MIYIESAKSGRSKCVKCGKAIEKFSLRLRLRVSGSGWGFIFCEGCVDNLFSDWKQAKD